MMSYFKFILFFIFYTNVYSQGLNNQWILGYDSVNMVTSGKTTLNFSPVPQLSWKFRTMNFNSTNASVSDQNGDLLFYTNGVYIANVLDDTMLNGSGLNLSSYTNTYSYHGLAIAQADLIIPFPSDFSKYYLFHETVDTSGFITNYLYYTVIDMTLDNNLGGVVSKNNILLTDSLVSGGITACRHANGRDWWLVCHQYLTNRYFKFLITPLGINGPFVQDIGEPMIIYGAGQTVFSPDGKKFASYYAETDLDIMDFDRCTGDFSNSIHIDINDSAGPAGAAFSPNSKLLYLGSTKYVYQFDLTAANILNTQLTVAVYDSFASPCQFCLTTFYLLQLAPDGKIYMTCGNSSDYFHVINYPDSLGNACDVCQHCLQLLSFNAESIPNFPNYFLYRDNGSICDSLPNIVDKLIFIDNYFNVFPNPVRNKFYITQNKNELINKIYYLNILNQAIPISITSINNDEYLEINTEDLNPGIYFLYIETNKQKVTKRIIKE